MAEHYTKATVQASYWCNRCGKVTMHLVHDRRLGSCMACIARLEEESKNRPARDKPKQGNLF